MVHTSEDTDAEFTGLAPQIAEYGAAVDPQAEKRLLRKLDFIILPQVTLLFLLNFIESVREPLVPAVRGD